MNQQPHETLIGGALFLESNDPALGAAQDHSSHFQPGADPFAEIVKKLLDSMSLFLTTNRGSSFITACSLDLPRDEHDAHLANQSSLKCPVPDDTAPATGPKSTEAIVGEGDQDQGPRNVTLRIARNGQFGKVRNQELKDFAIEIITFLQTGTPDEKTISEKILDQCKGRIKHCIAGDRRLKRFSAILKQLPDTLPAGILDLENLLCSENSGKNTPQNAENVYKGLVESLTTLAGNAKNALGKDWSYALVSVVITEATAIRRNKVYMALLRESLSAKANEAIGFLEGLAAYDLALNTLLEVRRRLGGLEPLLFTNTISISLLPRPNHQRFRIPSLENLARLVATDEEIHSSARNSYSTKFRGGLVTLKEHCEIQLVRFYIENPGVVPVMAYLGVSKLSCFLCSKFLEYLQNPDLSGPPARFLVRGEHGKVYGRWLPPDIRVTGDMQDRVRESLEGIANDIRESVRPRLAQPPVRSPIGPDSPPWPSDEQLDWLEGSPPN